jgi:hypothetical protein
MVLTDLLKHPKELFYKKSFIFFSVMLFFAVPLLRDLTDLTALMSNPIFQRFQYPPHLVFFIFFTLSWTFTALITYFMISHATTKNKTGILTFFAFSQSVRFVINALFIFFIIKGSASTHITELFFKNPYFFCLNEFFLNPVWLFFAWSLRRITQLNKIRESIISSPEAMQHLENLEKPTSKEVIRQVINYLQFRLPPSQQKLIAPLEKEASRRFDFLSSQELS